MAQALKKNPPQSKGRGGLRQGAGRKKGVPNKITKDVREVAQNYTAKALEVLANVMNDVQSPPAARVAAANSILDRAHGKPSQSIDHKSTDRSMSPAKTLADFYGERPE